MTRSRSVYIAYTGGTIGMRRGAQGYRPAPGFLAEQMARMEELGRPEMPRFEIHEYEPLLDSSNMTPADWMKLARDVMARYDEYDGFIVLHGTDTMAYSASALSFLFEGLGKTILFTGSQLPLVEVRNDARANLVTSLIIAAREPVPEVCLFAGSQLLRGNRATKVSADRFRAFASPNFPPLGRAGVEIEIDTALTLPPPTGPVRLLEVGDAGAGSSAGPRVADIRLFPGMDPDTLRQFLRPPLQGAVLHTYGAGNAPDDPEFLAVLGAAHRRGVVLVNCTQCVEGSVRMETYATGHGLRDAGVVSGWDMTPEAALTKLYVLLSQDLAVEEVRRRMGESLRGELSRP